MIHKKISITLTALFIFMSPYSNNMALANVSVIDDVGEEIELVEPAKKIVSLSPGLTELIYYAGGERFLKGVVSYSDFPKSAKIIPQVGSYNSIDIEKIVALSPDLVISWKSGNPSLQISKLKKLGIKVYTSELRDFKDISSTLKRLGILMGTVDTAEKAVSDFNKRFSILKKRFPHSKHKKNVFIQIWNEPLMSINGTHLISKIVEFCNGHNIFHKTTQLTLSLDVETIIHRDPDVIIATREGKLGDTWLSRWKKWDFMKAVKNNQLFTVNPDHVVRHTPRVLDGIEQVCGYLHSK